jgi:hypothetical protein
MLELYYEDYAEELTGLQKEFLYAVVYSYFENERCVGFKSLREAMQAVSQYSTTGVWSACFDLRTHNVVCYMSGYVYRKPLQNNDLNIREG